MPQIEYIELKDEEKGPSEEKQILEAIKQLDKRYRILIIVSYMMVFLLALIVWRLYEIFGILS